MEQIATLETQIKEFNKMVDRSQTSINHLKTFSAICQSYPITSADLAIKMDLKNSTLNRLLHSLAENSRGQTEAAELIEIEMDAKDRRSQTTKHLKTFTRNLPVVKPNHKRRPRKKMFGNSTLNR